MVISPVSSGTVLGLLQIVQIDALLVDSEGIARIAIVYSIIMVVPNAKYWGVSTQDLVERVHESRVHPVVPPQGRDGRDVGPEE